MDKLLRPLNNVIDRWSQELLKTFNNIPIGLLIGLILCLYYLSFRLNGNEEQYLQLSKQFMNPNWIPDSQNLTEFPGARLLYQYIFGSLLEIFSFNQLVFGARLIIIILLSFVLSKIYRKLKFNNPQVLLHLVILFLGHQSLFAGSWMFVSVEPKGIAYIFILLSIFYFISDKYFWGFIFLIVGSYFHFLVGWYTFFYLLITIIVLHKRLALKIKNVILYSVMYLAAMSPLIIYLFSAVEVDNQGLEPSPNWIYTYFRSPHHTALVPNLKYFYNTHFYGILLSATGLFIAVRFLSFAKKKSMAFLNYFVIISLLGTLLLVLLAFLDKEGRFLKYYPYRINTLSTFFLMLLFSKWALTIIKETYKQKIYEVILLFSLLIILKASISNIISNTKLLMEEDRLVEACQFIKKETEKGSVIFSFINGSSLTRLTERDRFVVEKFIPAELGRVNEWYDKVLERRSVLSNRNGLKELVNKYKISHILCNSNKVLDKDFQLLYKNEQYAVYQTTSEH